MNERLHAEQTAIFVPALATLDVFRWTGQRGDPDSSPRGGGVVDD
jgi:hypothetical protein